MTRLVLRRAEDWFPWWQCYDVMLDDTLIGGVFRTNGWPWSWWHEYGGEISAHRTREAAAAALAAFHARATWEI